MPVTYFPAAYTWKEMAHLASLISMWPSLRKSTIVNNLSFSFSFLFLLFLYFVVCVHYVPYAHSCFVSVWVNLDINDVGCSNAMGKHKLNLSYIYLHSLHSVCKALWRADNMTTILHFVTLYPNPAYKHLGRSTIYKNKYNNKYSRLPVISFLKWAMTSWTCQ